MIDHYFRSRWQRRRRIAWVNVTVAFLNLILLAVTLSILFTPRR